MPEFFIVIIFIIIFYYNRKKIRILLKNKIQCVDIESVHEIFEPKKIFIKNANQINLAFVHYLNKKNTLKDKILTIKLSELINKVLTSTKRN